MHRALVDLHQSLRRYTVDSPYYAEAHASPRSDITTSSSLVYPIPSNIHAISSSENRYSELFVYGTIEEVGDDMGFSLEGSRSSKQSCASGTDYPLRQTQTHHLVHMIIGTARSFCGLESTLTRQTEGDSH